MGNSSSRDHQQAGVGRPFQHGRGGVARLLLEGLRLEGRGQPRPAVRRLRAGQDRRPGRRGHRPEADGRGADRVDGVHRHRRRRDGQEGGGRRRQGHRAADGSRRPGQHGHHPGPERRISRPGRPRRCTAPRREGPNSMGWAELNARGFDKASRSTRSSSAGREDEPMGEGSPRTRSSSWTARASPAGWR